MRITKLVVLLFFIPVLVYPQGILKINSGANLVTAGNTIIVLQDMDLSNDGIINQTPGNGAFKFTGTINNVIGGSSNPLFDMLTIAKSGNSKVSLQQGINVGSSLQMSSGLLDMNNNNILLSALGLVNGETESSRITGLNGGYIQITGNLNSPVSANPGNLGAVITSAQNLGSTVIRRGHVSQTSGTTPNFSINRYYDILPSNNNGLNATLRINYFNGELNSISEAAMSVWKSADNINWSNMGFTLRDTVANYFELNNVNDFSRWTLASVGLPLPVQFAGFTVQCENNRPLLTWKTAMEQNSDYFQVQRSEDGIHFVVIATLKAAGNSSMVQDYSYVDNSNTPGRGFYRITETDRDGRSIFTNINSVQCENSSGGINIWPNPATDNLFININTVAASPITIKIFDADGALVHLQNSFLTSGSNLLKIATGKLAAGSYYIIMDWDKMQLHKVVKFVKL